MTSISLRPKPGQGPKDAAKAQSARLRKAIASTAYKIASEVQQRGRVDIAQAGRFGPNSLRKNLEFGVPLWLLRVGCGRVFGR